MKWVTRARPKTDRIACPWLIRRFIDADAEILYVPVDQVLEVAHQEGARSFDADGAEFTHRGDRCSFEVLIDDFRLGDDPALMRLARVTTTAYVPSVRLRRRGSRPCPNSTKPSQKRSVRRRSTRSSS